VITGLAGSTLWGLLPGSASFLIVCIALGGLGLALAPKYAFMSGLLVLAAANIAYDATGKASLQTAAGQDIGAASGAQVRAEDLLARLRTSQAAQAEAAALTERARLAREIHDILAHALSGLVLALDTMELLGRQAGADPEVMARIMDQVARAQRIARDGLADTRRAIAALRGDELPGPALLDRLVAGTAAATGIKAVLSVTGKQRPLPPEIGLALYRTAQETLTNSAKYAGRDGRAELRLIYSADGVALTVEDARSRDAAPPPAGLTFGGYGLTGIRERAELLGGTLTAGPTESGFKVQLRLPTRPAGSP
jgi:signal transduction histidine kinase